uniref:Uncharacterized protein n=1 Tax=Opuntia streptacantha TaxID=393608 RepID=A0A7C8Z441_OPUST
MCTPLAPLSSLSTAIPNTLFQILDGKHPRCQTHEFFDGTLSNYKLSWVSNPGLQLSPSACLLYPTWQSQHTNLTAECNFQHSVVQDCRASQWLSSLLLHYSKSCTHLTKP